MKAFYLEQFALLLLEITYHIYKATIHMQYVWYRSFIWCWRIQPCAQKSLSIKTLVLLKGLTEYRADIMHALNFGLK
jgi:hypothetical protein